MSFHVDIKDLPERYQKQAIQQIIERTKNENKNIFAISDSIPKRNSIPAEKKKMKYRSQAVKTESGIQFRSKLEEKRYHELMSMLKAGIISDLKLEPQFTLIEGYKLPDGTRVKRMHYTADFSYQKNGKLVVEDVKSRPTKTTSYQIRKNMMKNIYGIAITEIEKEEGNT